MSIKINEELYKKYKAKLADSNISVTDGIENLMRDFIGETSQPNVADVFALTERMEKLEKLLGELQPNWQQKTLITPHGYKPGDS